MQAGTNPFAQQPNANLFAAPSQPHLQSSQQPQQQLQQYSHAPQSQIQQQVPRQQQAGVNSYGISTPTPNGSAPQSAVAPSQPQMSMVVAGAQSTSQWNIQPQQNLQQQQQQHGQNLAVGPSFSFHNTGTHGSNLETQSVPDSRQQMPYPYGWPASQTQQPTANPVIPQQQQQQVQQPTTQSNNLDDDFFGDFATNKPKQKSSLKTTNNSSQRFMEIDVNRLDSQDNVSVLSKLTSFQPQSPFDDPTFAPRPPRFKGLEKAKRLAQSDPSVALKLPDFEKVTHSGFVLARISVRTILFKKWHQVYWITYGTNKLLIFRTKADFEEWMSNPYLSEAQRKFLIKLEVDFVNDVYKDYIMTYVATNIRSKNYQNRMLGQFKLEVWMDYGPTIAAAFGSSNERELYNLRAIMVEMIKMSPTLNKKQGQQTSNRNFDSFRFSNTGFGFAASPRSDGGAQSEGEGDRSNGVRGRRSNSTGPMERAIGYPTR